MTIRTTIPIFFLLCACLPIAQAVDFEYTLEEDASVTIVIEDEEGCRVRNLVSEAQRTKGLVTETWDGRNDIGQSVEPGVYRWRGIRHGGIKSHYIGNFCSPHSEGATPWKHLDAEGIRTQEGGNGGGWLSDHAAPSIALAVGDEILLGCNLAEEGDSIIRVTPEGRKIWGARWQALVCPAAIAFDPRDGALYVAGEGGWIGKDRLVVVRRLLKNGKVTNYPVPKDVRERLEKQNPAFADQQLIRLARTEYSGLVGMSVIGDFLALALTDKNRIALFDTRTALHVRDIPLPEPVALCGDHAISGKNIVRIDPDNDAVIALCECEELLEPRGLAIDGEGHFHVSDAAPGEMCVKVFNGEGRLVRTIGKKGGRREGRYDPKAMDRPAGLAIDAKGQLWVTEDSPYPRRVSVWTPEGRLVREFVGGARYGGGGSISGGKGYYGGMRFKLHKAPRQGELEAILFRPEEHPGFPFDVGKNFLGPDLHQTVLFNGRRYLMADDGWVRSLTIVAEEVGDRAVLRAAWGEASELRNEQRAANGVFLWSDANGDGQYQPEELSVHGEYHFKAQWALRSAPGLDAFFYHRDGDGRLRIVRIRAHADRKSKVPRWDFSTPVVYPIGRTPNDEIIGASPLGHTDDIIVNLRGSTGGRSMTNNVLLCASPGGRIRWTYPNPYPTNGTTSPVPKRGEIRHTLNAEGFAEAEGFGMVWLLNGNFGTRYLFSEDGLFITELFRDQRVAGSFYNIHDATPGRVLSGYSALGECFYGWLGNGDDGRVLQIIGKQTCNVCELSGFDTLRRLPGGEVHLEERAVPLGELPQRERSAIRAIEMEGNWMPGGEQWYQNAPNVIEAETRIAAFAVGSGYGATLAVQIRVEDDSPFLNKGDDFTTMFHTGDCVDIRFAGDSSADPKRTRAVAGDVRYLVVPDAEDPGKARVIRYTYVDPEAKGEPVVFASPVGSCEIARVEELKGCGSRVVRDRKGYTLSVTIPGHHLPIEKGKRLSGATLMDVGVIFGNETGSEVKRREYFFDDESRIVHDIPSEAGVNPSLWGTVQFR
ncbi:MAG: FlgD immunoglobulin-like domain containing protein [Kiritimatiellia bacterium]|jgi:sugar lactone lactonase YvrE